MIRYINYVLTAIMIMLVLPFAPFLAVAAIPIAFIYYLIMPQENFFQNFSFRRMVRRIGFKPPKRAIALYIFWLYIHLVCLGAFSSGMFSSLNMSQFWPFAAGADISVYDITEFMAYTGPPLFFILLYGFTRNELSETDNLSFEAEDASTMYTEYKRPAVQEEPIRSAINEPVLESRMEPVMPAVAMPQVAQRDIVAELSGVDNQELLRMIQRQQEQIERLDTELRNVKSRMRS